MREKLVIRLHADALTNPDWVVVNANGDCSEQMSHGEPIELERLARNREVMVIVPAESILLTSVVLPKMNRARLLKALPFALEEQLVDDIEKLHFSSSDFDEDGRVSVAIVTHELMRDWIELLNEWQIKPDAIVPMTLAIPFEENVLTIVANQIIDVRTGVYSGFACDRTNMTACLNLAFTDQQSMPSTINILNIGSMPCADELRVTAKILEDFVSSSELLEVLARTVSNIPYINLLQGAYSARKSHLPQTQRFIRGIMMFAACWVALLFLYPMVSYFILGEKLSEIDSQISHIYKLNFPQSASMVAPKIRMSDKLRELEGQTGQNKLLTLLGYVGAGLANSSNIKLSRLDYQGDMLTLELSAGSSDDFSGFADYLTSQGLSVKQENATLSGSRVNATLQVQ